MSAKKPSDGSSNENDSIETNCKEESEKEFEKFLHSTDPHVMELQRKVSNVFNVFDQSELKAVDIREVGTILRALGMFPTEADVQEILHIVEEPSSKGLIKHDRLVPYIVKLMLDGNPYPPISEETLKLSFMVLDYERASYFEIGRIKSIMMKEGEPFSREEFEEMMKFGYNKEEEKFDWRAYMTKAGINSEEKPHEVL